MAKIKRPIDVELLTNTLEVIKKIARRKTGPGWYQGSWRIYDSNRPAKKDDHRCQTAMCFAGWAAELDPEVEWLYSASEIAEHDRKTKEAYALAKQEGRPAHEIYEHLYCEFDEEAVICPPELRRRTMAYTVYDGPKKGTKVIRVGDWAEWRLGLTGEQAHNLFSGNNQLRDLKKQVSELVQIGESQSA